MHSFTENASGIVEINIVINIDQIEIDNDIEIK